MDRARKNAARVFASVVRVEPFGERNASRITTSKNQKKNNIEPKPSDTTNPARFCQLRHMSRGPMEKKQRRKLAVCRKNRQIDREKEWATWATQATHSRVDCMGLFF